MDLQQRKQALLNYILEGMDKYAFERGLGFNDEVSGFKSYNEFAQYQLNIINGFNEGSVKTMEFLKDGILPMSEILDEESMTTMDAGRFYFSKDGKIVFVSPR